MRVIVRREQLIFAGAIVAGIVHGFDESFFSSEATPVSFVVIQAALGVALAACYPRLRRWRGALALALGLLFVGQGLAAHLLPLLRRGAEGGDWTGAFLYTPASLVLIGLGLSVLAQRRAIAARPAA